MPTTCVVGIIRKGQTEINDHLEHVAGVWKGTAWNEGWINRQKIHVLILIHLFTS